MAHVLTKYYDKVSVDTETFKKVLDKSKPNPRLNSFKEIASALKMEEKPKIVVTKVKAKKSKKNVEEEAMAKACAE